MRFVSLVNSLIGKTRRAVTQPASTQDMDPKDTAKLSETIRQLTARLNKLEAAAQPEATEFEVDLLDTGGLVELPHGFKTKQVRWTVVGWFCKVGGVSPVMPPNLVYDTSSTSTSLFLRSYIAGRAIIRVEPAQAFLDTGNTIDVLDTGGTVYRSPFGRMRARVTTANTTSTPIISVQIPDNSMVVLRTTVIGRNRTTPGQTLREVAYWSCYRNAAGAVTSLTATVAHTVVIAGMTYTFVAGATDIAMAVQCTTAAQTVDWSVVVEPVNVNLLAEP